MAKKLLTFALTLGLAVSVMAQLGTANPTVDQNDIEFWTGTGSNRAVVAITWNDDVAGNIGLAWGVQWEGEGLLVRDIMDTIAAYDPRLTVVWNSSHSYVNNLTYTDERLGLDLIGKVDPEYGYAWFFYNWLDANGGEKQSVGVTGDVIANGDFVDWLPMDPETYMSYAADEMLMATDPNTPVEPQPEEASIAASQVTYWVGTGDHQVVMAVNWADTALAWGFRFATESVTTQQVMDSIAAHDHRFSYALNGGYLDDILFVLGGTDTFSKAEGSYWESKSNGVSDIGLGQTLADGDFVKWAEPAAGVVVDSIDYGEWGWAYLYVYPMTIYPVSDPAGIGSVASVEVMVWPNPAAELLNVSCEPLERSVEASLYDMGGRRLFARTLAAGATGVQIPVGSLGDGLYLLRMGEASAKIVVRH